MTESLQRAVNNTDVAAQKKAHGFSETAQQHQQRRPEYNHALHDYQTQLAILKQEKKERQAGTQKQLL